MAGVGAGSVIFMSAYIRTVKTLSGATAVQVVFHEYSGKKSMEHVGSARNEHELALLTAQAQQIVDGGQLSLDFGFAPADTPLRGIWFCRQSFACVSDAGFWYRCSGDPVLPGSG